ncbi:MAG: murein L,D-transpeptidase [Myxococcales bacterium]|nr:murein L,D-transpeptidase [Myxococcales bacterium]
MSHMSLGPRTKMALFLVGTGAVLLIVLGGLALNDHADEGRPHTRAASKQTMKKVRQRLHLAMRRAGFQPNAHLFIRVFKHSRTFEVFAKRGATYALFRSYRICTFSGGLGPKLRRGDYQTPEGFYLVTKRRLNPHSSYHLSFNVGYPNRYDRAHKRTGSAIMVHGDCVSAGCLAMTDRKIREIYALTEDALTRGGQTRVPIHIFPFRMTARRRAKLSAATPDRAKWRGFWDELQPGYDAFEQTHVPPRIRVRGGRYVVQRRGKRLGQPLALR